LLIFSGCSQLLLEAEIISQGKLSADLSMNILDENGVTRTLQLVDANADGLPEGADVTGDGSADFKIVFDEQSNSYISDINRDGYADGYLSLTAGGELEFTTLSEGRGRDMELVFIPGPTRDFIGFNTDSDAAAETSEWQLDDGAPIAISPGAPGMSYRSATLSWADTNDTPASFAPNYMSNSEEISFQVIVQMADPFDLTPGVKIDTLPEIISALDSGDRFIYPFGSPQSDINSQLVFGLRQNTQYWFNILIRDSSGNVSAGNAVPGSTLSLGPIPGNTTLTVNPIGSAPDWGISIAFEQAVGDSDPLPENRTQVEDIWYNILISQTPDLLFNEIIAEWALDEGLAFEVPGWPIRGGDMPAAVNEDIYGLEPSTNYFVNVFAVDRDGYFLVYNGAAVTTNP
jgi:hypothetical protein